MVFIIDDLIYGVTLGPLMFILTQVRNHALKEMYPLEKINDQIKENRLLFEFGEIAAQEYQEKNKELLERREVAEKIWEEIQDTQLDILPLSGLLT